MTLAVCCMSHTPLLDLTDPGPELTADVESAFATAREFVRGYGAADRFRGLSHGPPVPTLDTASPHVSRGIRTEADAARPDR